MTNIPMRTQKPSKTAIMHHQKRARSCCSFMIYSLWNKNVQNRLDLRRPSRFLELYLLINTDGYQEYMKVTG